MTSANLTRRAVLYGRVSKLTTGDKTRAKRSGRDQGKSVDQQLDALRAIAQREGVEVVAVKRDDGISASSYARPTVVRDGWVEVMELISTGRVTELWVWEISRATRDRPVMAALMTACVTHHVMLTINGRVHDPTDPDDAFLVDLTAALAVRESGKTSERIKRDTAARAAQGRPHGRVPFGYAREYDPQSGALLRQVPDPMTSKIVVDMVNRVRQGHALYRIAADLNRDNVPSPETVRKRRNGDPTAWFAWRPDQVRDIVASPTIAGLRVHKGAVLDGVEADWPPLIPVAHHRELVAKFADPKRRTWIDASAKHLLTGIAVCGVCCGEIRRISNRGTPAYACTGRRHGHDGSKRFCVARKIEWVDAYIEDVIVERLSRPDLLDAFRPDDGGDVDAARAELVGLRAEHSELLGLAEKRSISLGAFARLEPALLARIDAAERRARPADVPTALVALVGDDAAKRWEGLALEQKRAVIRLLVNVRIHKSTNRHGTRTFDPTSVEVRWLHSQHGDAAHESNFDESVGESARA